MPSADTEIKSSWADQVEEGENASLPSPTEVIENGMKTVIEYRINDDGKKVKVTRLYKIETRKVSKSIARRKELHKFGAASKDKPGPNPANTIAAEDVFMQFVTNKDEEQKQDDDVLSKLKGQKMVKCRICKEDHWTTQCPYKDTLGSLQDTLKSDEKAATGPSAQAEDKNKSGGKYLPPSLREGASRGRGESMQSNRREEAGTIRVTNLSEDTRESDLQELFSPFGPISRIYLAKDKNTGKSKGFAFVNYHKREHAAAAIVGVQKFRYNHLVLSVEWAKPSGGT